MIAISYGLHFVAFVVLLLAIRALQYRQMYETAMGNLLRPAAEHNAEADVLRRAVYRHYNIAASCSVLARIAAVAACIVGLSLAWRVSTW